MAVAISYVRWSTDAQTGGDSNRRQITAAQDYAQSRGLRLIESFRDSGLSAYRGKNARDGALGDLIAAANDGHVPPGTVLIIESLDRLSRQSVDKAVMLLLQLLNMGIEVVTLFDKMVYKSGDNDLTMRLMAAIMVFGRAHDESLTKSKRGQSAWIAKHQAAAEGKIITKSIPSWLNIVDGKMVINEHGNNIRKIIDMALNDNVGCHTIANRLNASNKRFPSSNLPVGKHQFT